MKRGRLAAIAALLIALAASAHALDRLTVHSGLLYITNGIEDGAPSALVPPAGAWTPVPLTWLPGLTWEAGVMMMGLTYTWDSDAERGIPVEVEHANTYWVLGLAGDLRAVYQWRVADKLQIAATGGLLLLLRIPVIPHDDAASDWGSLAQFFALRSLFPEIGGGLRWEFAGTTAVVLQLRALYPLHNLWDADAPSAFDHFTAGLLVGIDFDL